MEGIYVAPQVESSFGNRMTHTHNLWTLAPTQRGRGHEQISKTKRAKRLVATRGLWAVRSMDLHYCGAGAVHGSWWMQTHCFSVTDRSPITRFFSCVIDRDLIKRCRRSAWTLPSPTPVEPGSSLLLLPRELVQFCSRTPITPDLPGSSWQWRVSRRRIVFLVAVDPSSHHVRPVSTDQSHVLTFRVRCLWAVRTPRHPRN